MNNTSDGYISCTYKSTEYVAANDNTICSLKYVKEIPLEIARPFIEQWHYSRMVPTGKNVFFGWYITVPDGTSILYAVADYGIGVNPNSAKYLSRITGEDVTAANLYELKRLCRSEPHHTEFPLTQFLSRCHKCLKKDHGIRYIESFSDGKYNRFKEQKDVKYNSEGIYKAANFIYLGKTNAEMHVVDKEGIRRHRLYAYRYMQREKKNGNLITLDEARQILGVISIKTEPKDRWFLDLRKSRMTLATPARECGGCG